MSSSTDHQRGTRSSRSATQTGGERRLQRRSARAAAHGRFRHCCRVWRGDDDYASRAAGRSTPTGPPRRHPRPTRPSPDPFRAPCQCYSRSGRQLVMTTFSVHATVAGPCDRVAAGRDVLRPPGPPTTWRRRSPAVAGPCVPPPVGSCGVSAAPGGGHPITRIVLRAPWWARLRADARRPCRRPAPPRPAPVGSPHSPSPFCPLGREWAPAVVVVCPGSGPPPYPQHPVLRDFVPHVSPPVTCRLYLICFWTDAPVGCPTPPLRR